MFAYCVEKLRLSEDAAYKRIQASRAARQFPAIFAAVARTAGSNLTAVCLLAPHLTSGNAEGLIAAATHQTRSGIELILARRFPRAEALRFDGGISPVSQSAPGQVPTPEAAVQLAPGASSGSQSRRSTCSGASCGTRARAGPEPTPPGRIAPISPERYALQITIGKGTHDKLRYAQALLGHSVPSGEISLVLDRALDALICQLEKRKFAATNKPRRSRRPSAARRTIPAHVRREVWERDQGRCTFVSDTGHRCTARKLLEFDHVDPVARGGQATVDRMHLRCRAHNQHEAERAFGAEFMREKREQARREAGEKRAAAEVGASAEGSESTDTGTREASHADSEAGARNARLRSPLNPHPATVPP